jgi:NAD(P)-dependent dehydrogenase (short-subunit alcohol dehydrogenase family)
MSNTFQGKRIVLTGASRGIGYQAAKMFLAQGAEIFGTARDGARMEETARELKALGSFTPFIADMSDPASPKRIAEAVARQWDRVDLLINNAAVQTWRKDWIAEGVELLEQQMRINVFAPHELIFHLLPLIKKGRDPRVINVSSGAGTFKALVETPDMPTYRLTKYALNGVTILWAGELKGEVAVNSLDPGWLKTDLGGPNAPGEPIDGGHRVLALAALPKEVTGKFYYGDKEIQF